MAKIAIISSHMEDCGIAFYAERLKKNLETFRQHQVCIIALDLLLLKSSNPYFVRAGNKHIDTLAKSLSDYDAVVLQYEPGLYANNLRLAQHRVMRLLKKHPNILITLHSHLQLDNKVSLRESIKELLRGWVKSAITKLVSLNRQHHTHQFWKKISRLKHVKIHTHCQQDVSILRQLYGIQHIFDFPHALFTQQEVAAYKAKYDRNAFLRKYNLDPACKYVAIFGFYGEYKGHVTALKMLKYLPYNYHLLIVGGEHPQGMKPGNEINQYLEKILMMVQGESLVSRVKFLGHVGNNDVPEFYSVIDYVVLPYFNPHGGQSGSGPAAHALEFNCRILFSNAFVFRYLEKYFKGAMKLCNIGNYIEFAQNILCYENFENELKKNLHQAFLHYNPEKFVERYEEALGLGDYVKSADPSPTLTSYVTV